MPVNLVSSSLHHKSCAPHCFSVLTNDAATQDDAYKEEKRTFTKRFVRRAWARIWCTMLRKNVFACFRDTAAGVNTKTWTRASATAAQTGPYPPLDSSQDAGGLGDSQPRRPGGNSVGTVNTPVVVQSPRSEAIGRDADAWETPTRTPTRRASNNA